MDFVCRLDFLFLSYLTAHTHLKPIKAPLIKFMMERIYECINLMFEMEKNEENATYIAQFQLTKDKIEYSFFERKQKAKEKLEETLEMVHKQCISIVIIMLSLSVH